MRTIAVLFLVVTALCGAALVADATTYEVPSPYLTVSSAMSLASSGDLILVSDAVADTPSVAYADVFTIKSGVKVIAASGQTPIIDGGSLAATAVDFETDAASGTILDGFTVRGGTERAVFVRGEGEVRNCTIGGYYEDIPIGIEAEGSARIAKTVIRLSGDFDIGVKCSGGDATIDSCNIYVDPVVSNTEGVDMYASGTVSRTRVRVGDGIAVAARLGSAVVYGDTLETQGVELGIGVFCVGASSCLVDSCLITGLYPGATSDVGVWRVYGDDLTVARTTLIGYDLGVYDEGSGDVSAHHCIAVGGGWGFYDVVAEYCLSDAYWSGTQGTGSMEEDPFFCDADNGEYTLRVDSYGNPHNNGSGEEIGAFPVACMYGTLVRDADYEEGGTLDFPGDLTVPSGKTLTLGAATTVKAGPGDSEAGGADTTLTELVVDGTRRPEQLTQRLIDPARTCHQIPLALARSRE